MCVVPSVVCEASIALAALCPKFSRCSAPYCPAGLGGRHLPGERVCHYLRETVKPGGSARVSGYLPQPLAEAVIREGARFMSLTGPLSKALKRASKQQSRMVSTERYNRRRP